MMISAPSSSVRKETLLLTGCESPEEAAQTLTDLGVRIVIVTLGANGAYWRCGADSGTVLGFRVKVADTNGAGDTFFGAFLSRIAKRGGLDGLTPKQMETYVRYANRAASITASRPGAIPAMPTEEELTEEERIAFYRSLSIISDRLEQCVKKQQ